MFAARPFRARRGSFAALVLLAPALRSTPLAQGQGAQDRASAVDAGLEAIWADMDAERWDAARSELLALLAGHERDPLLLLARDELIEELETCLFHASWKAPELDDLISGKLVSWDEDRGQAELRYTAKQLGDWEQVGKKGDDIIVHPLTFQGSYRVEIEFSQLSSESTPGAIIGFDTASPVRIVFSGVYGMTGRIDVMDQDKGWKKADAAIAYLEPGAGQVATIRIGSGLVQVFGNGRRYLSAKRKSGVYGRIALFHCKSNGIEHITVQGDVQPSWFQGLQDKAARAAWKDFVASFHSAEVLPAWLVEAGGGDAEPPEEAPYPGVQRKDLDELLKKVRIEIAKGNAKSAPELLQPLEKDEATAAFRAYAKALCQRELGAYEDALASCEQALELATDHRGTRLLHAELLRELDRRDEALDELKGLLLQAPHDADAEDELVGMLLLDGRPEEAQAALCRAVAQGVPPHALQSAEALVLKARHGPSFLRRFEYATKHYDVVTDIDARASFDAANHLEASLNRFRRDLRQLPRGNEEDQKKYRVYLFSGEEGYQSYLEDVVGSRVENTRGLYSSVLEQLLIWNLPDRDTMLSVVRHEGFHQYFDRLVDDPPRWLNEGLAEYYAMAELENGKWRQDRVNQNHMAVIREHGLRPLADFVHQTDAMFFADVELSYAESWALVHWLQHGGREGKRIFDTLIDELASGRAEREAVDRAFAGADFADLDESFEAYLQKL